MTRFVRLSLAAAVLAALAGCSGGYAPRGAAPAPEAKAAPPPASTSGDSGYGAANTGGTYPYGAVPPAGAEAPATTESPGAEEGIVVHAPDGSVWVKPGATTERYRADVDSCYAYAQAQVAHDARIESDAGAALPDGNDGFGLSALRGRMSNFERTNRRPALFSNCMEAKGYIRR